MKFESSANFVPSPEYNRTRSPEIVRSGEAAHEVLDALDSAPEFVLSKNSAVLTDLPAGHFIVRREDPSHIISLMNSHEPVPISFVGGTPYANSVEWDPSIDSTRGLENAYLEGYSHKDHVVTVYGFEQPEDFYLEPLDDSQRVFNGVDRTRVRAASGYVPFEAVRFVTVRMPVNALPEKELSEDELDILFDYDSQDPQKRKPAFIYRTYIRKEEGEKGAVTKH